MQALNIRNLHIDIDNPASEIVPNRTSEINEDDWLPNLADHQEPGETAPPTYDWEGRYVILKYSTRYCLFIRPSAVQVGCIRQESKLEGKQ